jgi:hypothetical protein
MHRHDSEAGFTMVELLIASVITMVVMGVAFTTFKDALSLNESITQLADAGINLRSGTNIMVRDLLQVGRDIPTGGIALPGGVGAQPVYRPSPPGTAYTFAASMKTLTAITTGAGLGPTVDGKDTDLITVLMGDPSLDELELWEQTAPSGKPKMASNGASFDAGSKISWVQGNESESIPPIKPGDLILFSGRNNYAMQCVTRVQGSVVYFDAADPFRLNQRGAESGTVMQTVPLTPYQPPAAGQTESASAVQVRRVLMLTYYVHEETSGVPRLMRALNMFPPQALAGIIEDLQFTYDLVDGATNPADIPDLPYVTGVPPNDVTYTANQVRKINLHVGVRSELKSPKTKDYLRNHLSTIVSVRNLAYVDRYDQD